jgi:hypothetical protein
MTRHDLRQREDAGGKEEAQSKEVNSPPIQIGRIDDMGLAYIVPLSKQCSNSKVVQWWRAGKILPVSPLSQVGSSLIDELIQNSQGKRVRTCSKLDM